MCCRLPQVARALLVLSIEQSGPLGTDIQDSCKQHLGRTQFVSPESLPTELKCLALNTYFDGRGLTDAGQVAITYVVLNRVSHSGYPSTICGVVQQSKQGAVSPSCEFSWVCDGRSKAITDHAAWDLGLQNTCRAVLGLVADPTKGALAYHAKTVLPEWARTWHQTAVIDRHVFYAPP